MTTTPAIATLPEVTHHHVDVNGTRLHYVAGRNQRVPGPAGPRVPRDLVDLPQAHPVAGAQPPRLRR